MLDDSRRENEKKFLYNNFFFESLAVNKTTWKSTVEPDRPQYGACTFLAGYLELQIHIHFM